MAPYRSRATVAAMNHIAAALRGAKGQLPSLVAQRRPSFPVCVSREHGATWYSFVWKCSESRLVRKRCVSISVPVSQAFCSSSLRKRRIRPSLCVAASSLTRIHSRRRQRIIASTSAITFRTSRSFIGIFLKSIEKLSVTCVYLICTPRQSLSRRPPVVHVPSGSLVIAALAMLAPSTGVFSALAQCSRSLVSGQ